METEIEKALRNFGEVLSASLNTISIVGLVLENQLEEAIQRRSFVDHMRWNITYTVEESPSYMDHTHELSSKPKKVNWLKEGF